MKNDPFVKKYYYLIYIQYLGYRFHGWQVQPGLKTVHGMINKTLRFVFQHENFKALGTSRTDAMVSANSSAFELFVFEKLDKESFLKEFNFNLPADIKALSIEEVDIKFNIINQSKIKKYQYLFNYGEEKNHPFCAPFLVRFRNDLNIKLMQEGAKIFEGTHCFKSYCCKPTASTQFERTIITSEIIENNVYTANFFPKKSYIYRVTGKGFLRYQVRLMMGTLTRLGEGEYTLEQIKASLTEEGFMKLNCIAPPSGLTLEQVDFF